MTTRSPAFDLSRRLAAEGVGAYSLRSATTGSTRVAFHAGPAIAAVAVTTRTTTTRARVTGSSGATPKSMLASRRPTTTATAWSRAAPG